MILPDVNVLLYAFRPDAERHREYYAWLQGIVDDPAPYGMAPQALAAVLRIATHPRAFARPYERDEVLAFAEDLLGRANCVAVTPGAGHWNFFVRACRESGASGSLVQDAWWAALAIESGCEWISTDGDFARFPGLRWRRPF